MCIQFKKYNNLNSRPQISFCNQYILIKHMYVDWIIISHIAASAVREYNKLMVLY